MTLSLRYKHQEDAEHRTFAAAAVFLASLALGDATGAARGSLARAATGPPETTTVRVSRDLPICEAPLALLSHAAMSTSRWTSVWFSSQVSVSCRRQTR